MPSPASPARTGNWKPDVAAYLTWPRGLFPPREERWALQGMVSTGGMSIGGISQTVNSSGGGFWTLQQTGVWVRTRDQVRAWNALEAILDGGVTGIIVPMCAKRFNPTLPGDIVPHSDGAFFFDDTGYVSGAGAVTFDQAAALRATTVFLDVGAIDLLGGEHFTVNYEGGPRLHRVARVKDQIGDVAEVEIRPPLRAAVAAGTDADFANPRCVMKLASPEEMPLNLEMGKSGQGNARFVEAFGVTALAE